MYINTNTHVTSSQKRHVARFQTYFRFKVILGTIYHSPLPADILLTFSAQRTSLAIEACLPRSAGISWRISDFLSQWSSLDD